MKYLVLAVVFSAGYLAATLATPTTAADPAPAKVAPSQPPANPAIDMAGHLKNAQEAAKHRESRRVSEDEFIRMSGEEGTVVLDARSKQMYDLLHVKGAINLSFPDIDLVTLPKVLPDKDARILIYCNNNFTDPAAPFAATAASDGGQQPNGVAAKARVAFGGKGKIASLNLSTYATLYGYGYKNVYELAPLIDPVKAKLTFESTQKAK